MTRKDSAKAQFREFISSVNIYVEIQSIIFVGVWSILVWVQFVYESVSESLPLEINCDINFQKLNGLWKAEENTEMVCYQNLWPR